jgi:hypothetical protein
LSDEQKAKLTALGTDQNRNNETIGSLAQTCMAPPQFDAIGRSEPRADKTSRSI